MDRGLLAADGPDGEGQLGIWMILTIVPYYLMWVLISIKREKSGQSGETCRNWYEAAYAVCFTVFSVAILFPDPGLFPEVRPIQARAWLDLMQGDAYGMFPGALPDRAVAAVLAVRLRCAGDGESPPSDSC